jgi:hypothetical protein
MEMSNRTLRDGVVLVGAFHFLMAFLSLVGVVAVYIYGISSGASQSESLFMPIIGLMICILLAIVYFIVGLGIIRHNNSARMGSVFLSVVGIMSGFVAVIGALAINLKDGAMASIASVTLTALVVICIYSIVAFLDIFILIFLFNSQVRKLFYTEE